MSEIETALVNEFGARDFRYVGNTLAFAFDGPDHLPLYAFFKTPVTLGEIRRVLKAPR